MISNTQKAYMLAAKAVSKLSDHHQQLGCVIVNKHKIISSGYNSSTKCHRIQAELDSKLFGDTCLGKVHSEVSALIPLIKTRVDLTRATIYVYREHKDGTLAMARPCTRCMSLIKQFGIKTIVYTTDDGIATEKLIYN